MPAPIALKKGNIRAWLFLIGRETLRMLQNAVGYFFYRAQYGLTNGTVHIFNLLFMDYPLQVPKYRKSFPSSRPSSRIFLYPASRSEYPARKTKSSGYSAIRSGFMISLPCQGPGDKSIHRRVQPGFGEHLAYGFEGGFPNQAAAPDEIGKILQGGVRGAFQCLHQFHIPAAVDAAGAVFVEFTHGIRQVIGFIGLPD